MRDGQLDGLLPEAAPGRASKTEGRAHVGLEMSWTESVENV